MDAVDVIAQVRGGCAGLHQDFAFQHPRRQTVGIAQQQTVMMSDLCVAAAFVEQCPPYLRFQVLHLVRNA